MADVAHELRTPLAVMQGRLEGITDGIYPASSEQIAALATEARTLARLVDDLGSLANAEAGALSLRKEPTDIAALLHDTASAFASRAGVTVRVEADQLPTLEIDPIRIREVVGNLVSNAVRHAPAGSSVTIQGSTKGDVVTIVVRDEGPGIPADRLPRIFDRFSKDPDSPGSGLGLYIARALARAHGGEVTVASTTGSGTTMTVTLPRYIR
jgi:two-component system sensor histidine kinase BaeS